MNKKYIRSSLTLLIRYISLLYIKEVVIVFLNFFI